MYWPPERFPNESGFVEGARKEKLHHGHERNSTVIRLAKQFAWQRDETLPCEVCEFSFIKKYGELGDKFIEAHHKKPVAGLKPGQRTRVEDIALVCPNCHRMLHCGGKTRTIEDLKKLLGD
jgi:putative restriction endonuclease